MWCEANFSRNIFAAFSSSMQQSAVEISRIVQTLSQHFAPYQRKGMVFVRIMFDNRKGAMTNRTS